MVFDTLSIITLGKPKNVDPTVVVVVFAFIWIPHSDFPALLVAICTVRHAVNLASAGRVLSTGWIYPECAGWVDRKFEFMAYS